MALSTAAKAAVGLVVLLAFSGVAVGSWAAGGGLERPQVQAVSTEWGELTEETAAVELTVVVENPNPVGVPPVAGVRYTAKLNDVVVAEGEAGRLGLSPGTNRLELSVDILNDRIDDWWVTHVNNGERSTLTIEPAVAGPLGLAVPLPAQSQPVETDFLAPFDATGPTTLEVQGEPFLRVSERSASWGEATAEETPLRLSATLANRHGRPITIDGFAYVITMNDVTLGEGETVQGLEVAPGETGTLRLTAVIETPKIPDWWVSHLGRGEVTDLTVSVYGLVENAAGDVVRVPLVQQSATIQTDLLGDGGASVLAADAGPALDVTPPTITGTSLRWGAVTDETTEVEAVVGIDNPVPTGTLAELLTLEVAQTVTINGVTVADGATAVDELPAGEGTVTLTAELDNTKVPEWWARHLNNGETSSVTFSAAGRADVGVTSFPLELPTHEATFSTDLLAGLNADDPQPVTVGGVRVLTIVSSSGAWGPATAEAAPVDAQLRLRNDGFTAVTVRDVSYAVAINGVGLADDTAPGSWTVSPGETETVAITMTLDNAKMDRWWVTHLRNGETSTLSIDVHVTVEVGGLRYRVELDALGGDQTITTDILGGA